MSSDSSDSEYDSGTFFSPQATQREVPPQVTGERSRGRNTMGEIGPKESVAVAVNE